ncbi:MAG: hypothetical protein KJN64_06780 [Ignavibacteria bacterium]|nr:hypothetical protein [Ignavibacteria bacterium]
MKNLSLGIILILVFTLGCEDTSNIVNPVVNTNIESSYKVTDFDYELIPLPPKSALWSDSILTVSQTIDGSVGGRIIMDKYYIAASGDSVILEADLIIEPGSFQGIETITMTIDDEFAAIHFFPEMYFQDTLKLTQRFKGLDLANFEKGKLDFVFIHEDGTIELIQREGLKINKKNGSVKVNNARLLHFSRYGWIRSPEGPIPYPTPVAE